MNFKFEHLAYQQDAVDAVVGILEGQPKTYETVNYNTLGKQKSANQQAQNFFCACC